jgi:hypothetical protein
MDEPTAAHPQKRDTAALLDHQAPQGKRGDRHLHLASAGRDLPARRLRHRSCGRGPHRHGADPRDRGPGPSSSEDDDRKTVSSSTAPRRTPAATSSLEARKLSNQKLNENFLHGAYGRDRRVSTAWSGPERRNSRGRFTARTVTRGKSSSKGAGSPPPPTRRSGRASPSFPRNGGPRGSSPSSPSGRTFPP